MHDRLPTADDFFDEICALLDHRFVTFAGNTRNREWTDLLKRHLSTIAADRYGMQATDFNLDESWRNGVGKHALLWKDGATEEAAVVWEWRAKNIESLRLLLARSARLKVFLTDPGREAVDVFRREVIGILAEDSRKREDGSVLVVMFASGQGRLGDPMAEATKIMFGSSARLIPKASVLRH